MKKNKLIFSALPYVNNVPHLGNIIGCVLSSDIFTRYQKMRKVNALHICGTDEYGTACEIAADNQKTTPALICNKNYALHKQIYDWFQIHFDYFGRTTEKNHSEFTQEIFKKIEKNGFIEVNTMQLYFCESCKFFLSDRYICGICPICKSEDAKGDQCDSCLNVYKNDELINPSCALCKKSAVLRSSIHCNLKLGDLKEKIEKFVIDRIENWSGNAKEITKEWLGKELHSRCITRDLKYKWGVPVPKEGFEEKVFYVWFDAPIGYFTFTKNLLKNDFDDFMKNVQICQFMGKDNVSFHSIFFPAMLIASETNFFVDVINSTEYLLFEGLKFSKSRGHGIFGTDLIDNIFGPSDFWRFYLTKIRPEYKDSNFTYDGFKSSVNSELINNLGNFVNRVLKYTKKNLEGKIQYFSEESKKVEEERNCLVEKIGGKFNEYVLKMENIELKAGLNLALEISSIGNEYVQRAISGPADETKNGFSVAVSIVHLLAHLVAPFMPETSEKIFKMVNFKGDFDDGFKLLENKHQISNEICVLFKPFAEDFEFKK